MFFAEPARYPTFRRKDDPQCTKFIRSGFTDQDGRLKLATMAEPLEAD